MRKKGYKIDLVIILGALMILFAGYYLIHSFYEFFILGCQTEGFKSVTSFNYCLPTYYSQVYVNFIFNLVISILFILWGVKLIFDSNKENKRIESLKEKVASMEDKRNLSKRNF